VDRGALPRNACRGKEIVVNRQPYRFSLALTSLVLLSLAHPCPAGAQQPTRNMVALKASLTGPLTPRFVIPLDPEIRLGTLTAEGTSDLLGAVKFVEANTVQIGAEGKGISVTDGKGVLTAANGDALFITYSGLVLPSGTAAELAYVITGGRGRFVGATGSGMIHCVTDAAQQKITRDIEGSVSAPVAQ
jgi:hypothetical protein